MAKKRIFILAFILFTLTAYSCTAHAEGGNGNNSGEGLVLVSTNPDIGKLPVPVNAGINLTFNKNVVNMSVKDNNKTCFWFLDSNKKIVPIVVVMGDDQINPDVKRNITLHAKKPLKAGATYYIKISGKLQAKNGVCLEKDLLLKFKTKAAIVKKSGTSTTNKKK